MRRWPLIALVALAGCGGPMKRSELADSLETIESAAAEGALLASQAADDRTKTTFARVRARQLGETLDHEVEKLGDAEAEGAVDADRKRAVDIATSASTEIGEIQATPDDRSVAEKASTKLRDLADRASAIREQA